MREEIYCTFPLTVYFTVALTRNGWMSQWL